MVKEICGILGVTSGLVKEGITYLGFRLKLKGYRNRDWEWLVTKLKHKLDGWKHKYVNTFLWVVGW